MNDELCPICMDDFEAPAVVNCCHSMFCFECVLATSGVASKCPECGEKLNKSDIKILDKDKKDAIQKKKRKLKEKMDTLLELLQERKDKKILLFANYNETFNKIKIVLTKHGITHSLLTGQASHVAKTLKEFSDGKINVLMLNARFFGAGMNLQMATDIIMYHRFDKDLEEQVIGRAQRLGRKHRLNIFYLLHDNESHSFTDKTEEVDYDDWLDKTESSSDESEDTVSTSNKKSKSNNAIKVDTSLDTDDEDDISDIEDDLSINKTKDTTFDNESDEESDMDDSGLNNRWAYEIKHVSKPTVKPLKIT
jgi:superfamily II DNA or RNA helicase